MSIWSAQTILARTYYSDWRHLDIAPLYLEKSICNGMSFGLTAAGYDIRLGKQANNSDRLVIYPGEFELGHSLEYMKIPEDCQAIVHDKSSWARNGLSLFNTVLEPGWYGHITLELANHSVKPIIIPFGCPIAQVVFHQLDTRTDRPYNGKYQNQPNHPVKSLREGENAV